MVLYLRYLRRHVDVKTSLALPYMENGFPIQFHVLRNVFFLEIGPPTHPS